MQETSLVTRGDSAKIRRAVIIDCRMLAAVREDGMKALALVEAPDHVCCRYRVRAFESALGASGCTLTVQPLESTLWARLRQIRQASGFDVVILQRKLLPGWQLRELRKRASRLVFDFDDAVLYRDSYDPRGPHHQRRLDRFRKVVGLADAVVAGNAFLADSARQAGARPNSIHIIPTCMQLERVLPKTHFEPNSGLEMVWIGSSSTLTGLELRRELWERIGREVPGTRLRLVCDRFTRFDSLPVIERVWSEPTESHEVAAADVGISWLPDDLWSRGKCGLKILQYQAAGLPVVANPVGVHPEMIDHGKSGFLPSTPGEWVEATRCLAADPELRRSMGLLARRHVEQHYSVERWAAEFVSAVTGSPASTSSSSGQAASQRRPGFDIRSDRVSGAVALSPTIPLSQESGSDVSTVYSSDLPRS